MLIAYLQHINNSTLESAHFRNLMEKTPYFHYRYFSRFQQYISVNSKERQILYLVKWKHEKPLADIFYIMNIFSIAYYKIS